MNKKFCKSVLYTPPRLVEGKSKWYISFYFHDKTRPYKPTFGINRIKDIKQRRKRGEELCKKLEWWLSNGFHPTLFEESKIPAGYQDIQESNGLGDTNIIEAIEFIKALKTTNNAKDTNRTYRSMSNIFIRYLETKKLDRINISDFDKVQAQLFMDYRLVVDKVGNNTYNNIITNMRLIFNALEARGYIEKGENPFTGIQKKKKMPKKRRAFSIEEAKVVMERIKSDDTMLFYALILEYSCGLRPTEIQNLRFQDINLEAGVVFAREHTKNKKTRHITIPKSWLIYFDKNFFLSYPQTYYIFGTNLLPHGTEKCSDGTMYKRHKRILQKLQKEGSLRDITGLTLYSWRDSLVTDAVASGIALFDVQSHLDHSSTKMTLRYYEKPRINKAIRDHFPNNILK